MNGSGSTARGASAFRLEEATIAAIHEAMKSGEITCRQLVQAYLDRIEAYSENGPKLKAMISVNPQALEIADELDESRRRTGRMGPLHGIPVTLKDSIETLDMPTTGGSAVMLNAMSGRDATIVQRLREAGAVILAKNTLGDLSGSSYSTIVGMPRNPYNFDRVPGGSSSGSGVAVAANMTVLAVGEDTMTSVRTPAALTGIVGLRPTTGLISRQGIIPRKKDIDTAGPMARTVTDAAILLNVLAGPDDADPKSIETFSRYPADGKSGNGYADFTSFLDADAFRGKRIGIGRDFFGGDHEIDRLTEAAVETIRDLGATVVDVRFEPAFFERYVSNGLRTLMPILMYPFKEIFEDYLMTRGAEVPKTVEDWLRIYESEISRSPLPPDTAVSSAMTILREALRHSSREPAYRDMLTNVLPMLTATKRALFHDAKVDAIVMSYQPAFAAPIVSPVEVCRDPNYVAAPHVPAPNTIAGYGSEGFPMAIVPMGFGTQGLPMGLAIMGKPYDDGKILGFAYAFEQATRHRRPSALLPPVASEIALGPNRTGARQ